MGSDFFLTIRTDDGVFVTKGCDGVSYSDHKPWTFDDGKSLGSYNTQQHWGTVQGKLYLVSTRRGAKNDHIVRHRAVLFIAEVDPGSVHVLRKTEQVVVPENDATLGGLLGQRFRILDHGGRRPGQPPSALRGSQQGYHGTTCCAVVGGVVCRFE